MVSKPKIITFQSQHEEFLFLCKEYPFPNPDMGKVWDSFDSAGGFDLHKKYGKYSYPCMVMYHYEEHTQLLYCPGIIVNEMDKVPEGFIIKKFPARDYVVVTTEWMETYEEATGENGLGQTNKFQRTVQIPEGYERYDKPDNQIHIIEVFNTYTENGHRWEFWVPIKKVTE